MGGVVALERLAARHPNPRHVEQTVTQSVALGKEFAQEAGGF